jgi:hypothetical protein
MANALYDKGKEAILTGIDFTEAGSDEIYVMMVTTTGGGTNYTKDLAADQFQDDVTAAARIGGADGVILTSKTITGGVFDAADVTFTGVEDDDDIEALVLYHKVGATEGANPLIAYIDTGGGLVGGSTSTSTTPNDGNIEIVWNSSGIFSI